MKKLNCNNCLNSGMFFFLIFFFCGRESYKMAEEAALKIA